MKEIACLDDGEARWHHTAVPAVQWVDGENFAKKLLRVSSCAVEISFHDVDVESMLGNKESATKEWL